MLVIYRRNAQKNLRRKGSSYCREFGLQILVDSVSFLLKKKTSLVILNGKLLRPKDPPDFSRKSTKNRQWANTYFRIKSAAVNSFILEKNHQNFQMRICKKSQRHRPCEIVRKINGIIQDSFSMNGFEFHLPESFFILDKNTIR